jgi:hypothetical protein
VGSNSAASTTTFDCEVSGFGSGPGFTFDGVISSDAAVGANWDHDGAAFSVHAHGVDTVRCDINGLTQATITGEGVATITTPDGTFTGDYFIYAVDNRPPPTGGYPIVLSAQHDFRPTEWTDGAQSFSEPTAVTVPDTITVTAGDPAHQWAFLYFDDLRCKYRSDGTNYVFDECPDDPSVAAGDALTVSSARLRIQNGSAGSDGYLAATVDIGAESVPSPGSPDTYYIAAELPDGTIYEIPITPVLDGDITITPL